MEAPLKEWLYHTFTISRPGSTANDEYGNQSLSWTAVSTTQGKLEHTSSRENVTGREVVEATLRIIFDAGVDVRATDRITFGSRTFEVSYVLVRYDTDGTENHRSAWIEEIDGGA